MIHWLEGKERSVKEFIHVYGKYMIGGLSVGILAYFMMMSFNLVNDVDGIWHPSNFIAGDWEISLGRGLLRYADRARFGIVSDSLNSILTLLLIAITNALILKKFEINNTFYRWLIMIVLSVNPVICNTLSYSYTSVNYGLAYLFATTAFCMIRITGNRRKDLTAGIAGGLFMGISMSFYQPYICVTMVLAAIYILKILNEKREWKEALSYLLSGVVMIVFLGGGHLLYNRKSIII